MTIKALAYVGVTTTDLDAWEDFAVAVLGLAPIRTRDRLRLRTDHRSYRIDVRPSDTDAAAWIGWEVATHADLVQLRTDLEAVGIAVQPGSPELLADREVCDLIRFVDAEGLQHEVCLGALYASEPVSFTRAGAGFVTGDLGLGHVALGVTDFGTSVGFYCDVLGFRISDLMPDAFAFLRCNQRHHTAALMKWPTAGLHHMLLQAIDLEQVGKAHDAADQRGLITKTLGRHAIDELVSFYVATPAGFDIEFGFGGMRVTDADWVVRQVGRPFSSWGHKAVATS